MKREKRVAQFNQVLCLKNNVPNILLAAAVIVNGFIAYSQSSWWFWFGACVLLMFAWMLADDMLYIKAVSLNKNYYEHHRSAGAAGVLVACLFVMLIGYIPLFVFSYI